MSDDVQPKQQVKESTDEERAKAFAEEYEMLCKKHQFQVVVQPTFVARDDGTFSVRLISSVGKLPKEQ